MFSNLREIAMSFALLLAGVRKLLTHSNMQIIWVRRIGDLV